MDVGANVGIGDLVEQLETPLRPRAAVVELAVDERDDSARVPGSRASAASPRSSAIREASIAASAPARGFQRARAISAIARARPSGGELARAWSTHVVDRRALRHLLPDPGSQRRLEGDLRVELGLHLRIVGLGDRCLHRAPERLAREVEGVRPCRRAVHGEPLLRPGRERHRLLEQLERVGQLVALHSPLGRALQPLERLAAERASSSSSPAQARSTFSGRTACA